MSMSTAYIISLMWILVLAGTTFFNHKKERNTLFYSSLFALSFYLLAHVTNTLYFTTAPLKEVLSSYYLFYAAVPALAALGLFIINRKKLTVIMQITIALLCLEGIISYAIHIDRNVVALNAAVVPNYAGASKWWLWDIRNIISFIDNISIMLALTLPRIYQVKTDDVEEAYSIQTNVENYADKFKPSSKIDMTKAFLEVSGENLCFFDGVESQKNKNAAKVGLLLLNEAIKLCCYEPHRTKPVNVFGRFIYWLRS
ncbi:hypothetical protein [Alteromonas sp. a30]|uniref:hypothetical protein n=1 Tax=Alteromonas sp. a30 TaxID=2730917 RepID=UPI002281DED9|nr:hypothetical protein [Alteromonas sp. a30]MCY7293802.1 hypothetical protein [Alteromonas sp. a30]